MDRLFFGFASYIALAAEMTAVLIVAVGTIEAAIRVLGIVARPAATHGARKELWRRFGMWLLLALEFRARGRHRSQRAVADVAGAR
jgi:hypothetical protein